MPGLTMLGDCARIPWILGQSLLLAVITAMAALPADAQPFPADMCAADRNRVDLGCTANDIDIANVTVNNGVTSCVAGSSVTLDLTVNLQSNARDRNDIGIFIALDARSPIVPAASGGSASCAVFGLPFSPPPLASTGTRAETSPTRDPFRSASEA